MFSPYQFYLSVPIWTWKLKVTAKNCRSNSWSNVTTQNTVPVIIPRECSMTLLRDSKASLTERALGFLNFPKKRAHYVHIWMLFIKTDKYYYFHSAEGLSEIMTCSKSSFSGTWGRIYSSHYCCSQSRWISKTFWKRTVKRRETAGLTCFSC